MAEFDFYDWNKTFSYDAYLTFISTIRGRGKTYGFTKQIISDYLKHGWRACEFTRYKSNLPGLTDSYFNKIQANSEFPDYVFKADKRYMYIAKRPAPGGKPDWEVMGYFVALSKHQDTKNESSRFFNVRRIKLDEAAIDKRKNRFVQYLPNEAEILFEAVESVCREQPGGKQVEPRIYLLSNAVDLMNPYFLFYHIGTEPKEGYSWVPGTDKRVLLHYELNDDYAKAKSEETVAGKLMSLGGAGQDVLQGRFYTPADDFVAKKPARAKFEFGIVYNGARFGVWFDDRDCFYFVTSKIPNNARPVFSLTMADNRTNVIAARRAESALAGFTEMHYAGCIRYDSTMTQARFADVLRLYGVR